MKNLILTGLMICSFVVCGFAQQKDAALESAMQKFKSAIVTKNPNAVLTYISRTKGLTIMNTIDQGEAGNADKPMLDSKLKYATLAADFKKKGENYKNFFTVSEFAPSLFDNFSGNKGKWQIQADDKFMPFLDGEINKGIYVKWAKEGSRWVVIEIGRPIS